MTWRLVSTLSICPGAHSRGLSSLTSTLPRRGKGKGHYAVVRPGVPPPAPPTSRGQEPSSGDTSLASTASHNNDSLLLCDSLKVKILLFIGVLKKFQALKL